MPRYRFRPRLWAFALTCAVVAATVSLGNWQRGRADEKHGLAERREAAGRSEELALTGPVTVPDSLLWRRVAVAGEWIATRTVFLDNRLRNGRPGFEVVTPLRISRADAVVLVNRGWLPLGPIRGEAPPKIPTAAGEVRIQGIAVPRIDRVYAPGEEPTGPIRLNLDVGAYARETGLPLLPLVVEQHSESADGLTRDWTPPDLGAERNLGYAWQWYSFGLLAVVLFGALSMEKHDA